MVSLYDIAEKVMSFGYDHFSNDVVILEGKLAVWFLFHSYTNPPKLHAKQLNIAVFPGRTTVELGCLIIFGHGTAKHTIKMYHPIISMCSKPCIHIQQYQSSSIYNNQFYGKDGQP